MSPSSWRTCLLHLLFLTVFVGFLPLTSTFAATYTVTNLNDSGAGSLRDAIATANGTPADDMIVFAPGLNGTITLTTGELTIANNGTLSIDGEQRITVSGNDVSGVFSINVGANTSLNGLTITQGLAADDGGGIFNNGTVTITNSTLSGSSVPGVSTLGVGGGIFNNGTVTITGSTFSGNSSEGAGGGINNNGTLVITGSTFSGNSAGGGGGVINNKETLTITNSTFSGNLARLGGVIFNDGTVTITDSTLSDNTATLGTGGNGGAGIFNRSGTVTITSSTLSGNSAQSFGGGIVNLAMLTITNSTLSGNSAQFDGGGIDNTFGTVTITSSTLSDNSAQGTGGGIFASGGGTITVANTIIANSASGGDCALSSSGDTINAQNSLIEDSLDCVNGTNINNLTGDPDLGALTGSPAYFPLLANSIAIDVGDNSLIPADITTDQAGNPRIRNDIVDMGSFEFQGVLPPPAEVAAIPTLGQVALVLLGLLLSVFGVAAMRRGA